MPKLVIMTGSYLQASVIREIYQRACVILRQREGLLYVDVASCFQANLRDSKMALRRGAHMDNVWSHLAEELMHLAEMLLDRKALAKLARHERLAVANTHDLAALNPLDLRRVVIGNLAGSDNGYFQHFGESQWSTVAARQASRWRLNASAIGTFGFQPSLALAFWLLYLVFFQ